ncbi:MAG: hypothetical protein WC451_04590 [Patescibacteria group bacterium]|jgi:hypothetical protein
MARGLLVAGILLVLGATIVVLTNNSEPQTAAEVGVVAGMSQFNLAGLVYDDAISIESGRLSVIAARKLARMNAYRCQLLTHGNPGFAALKAASQAQYHKYCGTQTGGEDVAGKLETALQWLKPNGESRKEYVGRLVAGANTLIERDTESRVEELIQVRPNSPSNDELGKRLERRLAQAGQDLQTATWTDGSVDAIAWKAATAMVLEAKADNLFRLKVAKSVGSIRSSDADWKTKFLAGLEDPIREGLEREAAINAEEAGGEYSRLYTEPIALNDPIISLQAG